MATKPKRKTTPEAEQIKLWKRERRDLVATVNRSEREAAQAIAKAEREINRIRKHVEADNIRRRERIATLTGRIGD